MAEPRDFLHQPRGCFHAEVTGFRLSGNKPEAPVKSLRGQVVRSHAEGHGHASFLTLAEQASDQGASDSSPSLLGAELDVHETDLGRVSPHHPHAGVRALDHDDGFLRAEKAGAVIGAPGLELLAEKGVALRGVPARAGQLARANVGVDSQQKRLVGRSGGAERKFRKLLGGFFSQSPVASSDRPSAAIQKAPRVRSPIPLSPSVRAAISHA